MQANNAVFSDTFAFAANEEESNLGLGGKSSSGIAQGVSGGTFHDLAPPPGAAAFYVVRATDGSDWPIQADTVCLHGDGPKAVAFARRLRKELAGAGVAVRVFGA